MKKMFLVAKGTMFFFALFSLLAFANKHFYLSSSISGAANVAPGATEYYEASFTITPDPLSIIAWGVTGGTITSQNVNPNNGVIYCYIEWSSTPGTGSVSIYEDLGSQNSDKTVQICGQADGGPPQTICSGGSVQIGIPGVPGYSYSWTPTTGLNDPNIPQPIASPTTTTVYTVTMQGNGCPVEQTTVTVTVNSTPTISPAGPIEACVHYETGPWLTLTTNLSSNIQWYENGNAINGQNSSTLILTNNPSNGANWPTCSGLITVKNTATGCLSNSIEVTRKNFTSPEVYTSNNPTEPETALNYCVGQGGPIRQVPSLNSGTIYWWIANDPNGNPASGISITPNYTTSPNATISFSNYSYNTATIIAKALDNGCDGASDNSWNEIYTINVNQNCRNLNAKHSVLSSNNVSIFPNPAFSEIGVSSTKSIYSIEIFSYYYPASVKQLKLDGTNYVKVRIDDLKPGLYVCKVITDKGVEYLKFAVQR